MTKAGLTDITVVLDRSGSMSSCRDDTIGGFNSFIGAQKKEPGDCRISLYQFDDQYEPVFESVNIAEAPNLTEETFVPRGSTALLDAIGRTVNAVGARFGAMAEDERPERVLFVIQTDGHENASKEFTAKKIKQMITHQKEKYSWQFLFLGADDSAFTTSQSYGISKGQTLRYDTKNVAGTMSAVNSYTSNFRSAAPSAVMDMMFSEEERDMAIKDSTTKGTPS